MKTQGQTVRSLVIDCNKKPSTPQNLVLTSHREMGRHAWCPDLIQIGMPGRKQRTCSSIQTLDAILRLSRRHCMAPWNACVLDFLLAQPERAREMPALHDSKLIFLGTAYLQHEYETERLGAAGRPRRVYRGIKIDVHGSIIEEFVKAQSSYVSRDEHLAFKP